MTRTRRFVTPLLWIGTTFGTISAFWLVFGAMVGSFGSSGCIDRPYDPQPEPIAQVVARWDPLACGADPRHRVVFALEDPFGTPLEGSAPCNRGGIVLDAIAWGDYRGYVSREPRDGRPVVLASVRVQLVVDATTVRWPVAPMPAMPAMPAMPVMPAMPAMPVAP